MEYQGSQTKEQAFVSREWLAALRAFATFEKTAIWINNPVYTAHCNLKIPNLRKAKAYGFEIPDTIVTNSMDELTKFASKHGGKIIYKTLTYYYEDPDIAIFTARIPDGQLVALKENLSLAPCLFQNEVAKLYELRITVVGEEIFPVRINSQTSEEASVDWRRDQMDKSLYENYKMDTDFSRKLLGLHKDLGLTYGAYDFIVDKNGNRIFLEVNPGGQWLWLEQILGLQISRSIAQFLVKNKI